jgi:DNA-binding transcriptional regulator GbsR (MarR family)
MSTSEEDVRAEELFGDAVSQLFERFGMRAALGRTWSALYLARRPMDGQELRSKLGISVGALSNAINELIDLGFVHRVAIPGERRFFYRAETEMWPLVTRFIREQERQRLVAVIEAMRAAEERFARIDGVSMTDKGTGTAAADDDSRTARVRHIIGIGQFVLGVLDAVTERTKVELLAAQKWFEVSGKLGGEPLNRLRRRINAVQLGRKR